MQRNFSPLSAAVAAALALAAAGTAHAGEFKTVRNPIEGQYIVVLKPQAAALRHETARNGSVPRVADAAREIATTHRARLLRSYERALRGFVVRADDNALARLLTDPRVAYVEEDGMAYPNPTQTGATWGIDRVDQRDLPLGGTYTYNTTAAGVHAYIIDSGVLPTHDEFVGRIGNGFTAINDGYGSSDCNGHGTHVAGTTAGSTWGVAKGATVHPVRVFGCSGGSPWSTIIAGIDWVAINRQLPAVANLSLGGGANASADAAVENLIASGVTAVVAAGNQNDNACSYSPARAANAITVGATDIGDARSGFSNYGACLDIFAPGSGITSAWIWNNGASAVLDGTSMASPHVAGAAALYLAANPGATPAQVTGALIASATLDRLSNIGAGSPNRLLYSLGGQDTGKVFEQTDASGKVTIAVFERTSGVLSGHNANFAVSVPADYVVIGGGGEGKGAPVGNLLTASYPNADLSAWLVSTKDHIDPDPVRVRAWAIGLRVQGLSAAQLRAQIFTSNATSNYAAHPDATASLPAGYVLLGGGFRANWSGVGSLGTASAPVAANGWRARAKDHGQSSPATVTAYAIGLPASIAGIGSFESAIASSLSGYAAHPSTSAGTLSGYALSGCGAFVNWSGAGNLLWKIKPVGTGATSGCEVASKDHRTSSPASIYGYAIGLRAY